MIKRTGDEGIYNEVVEHNGVLHFAGLVAEDLSKDMTGQTADVLAQLDKLLAAHGSGRDRVLTALIFVTDMRKKPAMNEVWKAWFKPGTAPTRATIGVSDLEPNVLLEVVVTAAVK